MSNPIDRIALAVREGDVISMHTEFKNEKEIQEFVSALVYEGYLFVITLGVLETAGTCNAFVPLYGKDHDSGHVVFTNVLIAPSEATA